MMQPDLIPRFNMDYRFGDFLSGVSSMVKSNNLNLNPLKSVFGDREFFFTNSGRSSLYVILRALNLPKNSKIGVPLYSCTVVFDAILKAGHIPYFIDMDLDNYTMDPLDLEEKIGEIDAVVPIHTFGRPVDMDKIIEIAGDVPVIEDCAHSLFSEYKGNKTGTLGTVSFFSLAKYISAGDGGMIILNNKEFAEGFSKELNILNSSSSLEDLKHSAFKYVYSFLYHKPWFGMFAYSLGSQVENNVDIAGKRTFTARQIGTSNLKVFLKKLESFEEKVKLQRENSLFLISELDDTNLVLPYESKDAWCNYFFFPVLFDNKKERDSAQKHLREMAVDSAKLFAKTPESARIFYGYEGGCSNTEDFVDRVLIVPNYYTLNEKDHQKVANALKKVCS